MINPSAERIGPESLERELAQNDIFKHGLEKGQNHLEMLGKTNWIVETLRDLINCISGSVGQEVIEVLNCTSTPLEKKLEKTNILIKKVYPDATNPLLALNCTSLTLQHLRESFLSLEGIQIEELTVLFALTLVWRAMCSVANISSSER